MVLKYKDKEILTLEDIQRLTVKDLRNILKSNSENAGGMKADLVLKVYALLMRDVVVRSVENTQQTAENCGENSGHFKYDETMRRISALGWSTDLRQLPELNFIQLYDYLVVSTRKYRHILLKGTHYKKLKSYQFFFEGTVKRLESSLSRSDLRESQCSSINEKKSLQSCCGAFTTERYFASGMHVSGWTWFIRKR